MGTRDAVLFDLDDTLIDSALGRLVAEAKVSGMLAGYLRGLGVAIDGEDLLQNLSLLGRGMNRRHLYNRSIWWQVSLDKLGLEVTLPQALVSDMTREYWSYYGEWSLPFPDTVSTLESLLARGYLLGVVTDTDGTPGVKMRRISLLGFKRAFSVVVIAGDDTLETKPSVIPFKLAASRLGLSCAECVFVGDKPFTDIRGARGAGMKSVFIKRGFWESDEQADLVVGSLSELCRVL